MTEPRSAGTSGSGAATAGVSNTGSCVSASASGAGATSGTSSLGVSSVLMSDRLLSTKMMVVNFNMVPLETAESGSGFRSSAADQSTFLILLRKQVLRKGQTLLSLMSVLRAHKQFQFFQHLSPQLTLGQHSSNRLTKNSVRSRLPDINCRAYTTTAGVTTVAIVCLCRHLRGEIRHVRMLHFIARKGNLFNIRHNHSTTTVNVRCVSRFVLAHQDSRNLAGNSTDNLAFTVQECTNRADPPSAPTLPSMFLRALASLNHLADRLEETMSVQMLVFRAGCAEQHHWFHRGK